MRSSLTGHVSPTEWRWVTAIVTAVLILATVPILTAQSLQLANTNQIFMGIAHDYWRGAASLSRMVEGGNGQFIVQFQHTSETYTPTLIEPLYPALGQITASLGISYLAFFHLMRLIAALLMYFAIYQLAASIWVRVRTRRIFFVITAFGGGLGWLLQGMGIGLGSIYPDLTIVQGYPSLSALVNVHFPLAIACVALIASVLIPVFRPGEMAEPSVDNGGALLFLLSLVLGLIYPDALMPLFVAALGSIIWQMGIRRRITWRDWRWGLWFIVPALPLLLLWQTIIGSSTELSIWLAQRNAALPSPIGLLVGAGLVLLIAVPGLHRAITRFEPDGDRFMIFWLLAIIALMYVQANPFVLLGWWLPLGYFAARASEDFWFRHIKHRHRSRWYVAITPLVCVGIVFWWIVPFITLGLPNSATSRALTMEADYVGAIEWLNNHASDDQVVLSDPHIGLWIPTRSNLRVVFGHPTETLNAREKITAVRQWYGLNGTDEDACLSLIAQNRVAFVLYGMREAQLGGGGCTTYLTHVDTIGAVQIFVTVPAARDYND